MATPARLTLVCAAAAVILTAAAGTVDWAPATRDGLAAGQLWRLFTGPLVHATWGHLIRDLVLLIFVGAGYGAAIGGRFRAVFAAGLAAPTAVVFVAEPDIAIYFGTSGLTHALLAAAVVAELTRGRGLSRWLAAIVGAGLTFKLAYELHTGAPLFPMDLGAQVRQLPSAHAAGAVAGAIASLHPRRALPALGDLGRRLGGSLEPAAAVAGPVDQGSGERIDHRAKLPGDLAEVGPAELDEQRRRDPR